MKRPFVAIPFALLALAACGSDSGPNGPSSILGAVSVSAGAGGTCAVGGSGGLACWGELPNGTTLDTATTGPDILGATTVTTPIDIIAIALSRFPDGNSGCLVGSDHATYCWGFLINTDVSASLGTGIQALAGATSASSVAISQSQLCVTRTDNLVRCYGAFYGGARGTDSVDLSDAGPGFSLTPTGLHPSLEAFGTALGQQSGCALRTDSLIACWGTRHRGQLGGAVGDTVQDCSFYAPSWCQPGPATIAGGNKYRQVASYYDHVCATRISGGVDCWGRKFGSPDPAPWSATCATASDCVNTPTAVTLPASAVRVVVGWEHACALVTTGDVYCWGDNTYGQLGRAGAASATPVLVSGGFTFTTLSAGLFHTCAVEAGTGAVGCWGRNDSGQLGDGTTTDRDHPVAVVVAE